MGEYILFSWTLWETSFDGPMHLGIFTTPLLPLILYGLFVYIAIGVFFKKFFNYKLNKAIVVLFFTLLLLKLLGFRVYLEKHADQEVFYITYYSIDFWFSVIIISIIYIIPIFTLYLVNNITIEKKFEIFIRYCVIIAWIFYGLFKFVTFRSYEDYKQINYVYKLDKETFLHNLESLRSKGFNLYEKEQEEILKKLDDDPLSIKNYPYQSEEMKLKAVRRYGYNAIQFVHKPSFTVKKEALEYTPSIKYINTKNNQLIKNTIKENPFTILEMDHLKVKEEYKKCRLDGWKSIYLKKSI